MTNALSPAKVQRVTIVNDQDKVMEVVVEDKQLSLAIGKKGQNVRLAAKLTGWRIDIKSEEEKRKEVEAQLGALDVPPRRGVDAGEARDDARRRDRRACEPTSVVETQPTSGAGRPTKRCEDRPTADGEADGRAAKSSDGRTGELVANEEDRLATVRIYKVAELLNTTSQEVLQLLKQNHGIELKSASSTLEEIVARQFVERLARQRGIELPKGDIFSEAAAKPVKKTGGAAAKKAAPAPEPPKPAAPSLPPPRLIKTVTAAGATGAARRSRAGVRDVEPRAGRSAGTGRGRAAAAAGRRSRARARDRSPKPAAPAVDEPAAAADRRRSRRPPPAATEPAPRRSRAAASRAGRPLRAAEHSPARRRTGQGAAEGAAAAAARPVRAARSRASAPPPPRPRRAAAGAGASGPGGPRPRYPSRRASGVGHDAGDDGRAASAAVAAGPAGDAAAAARRHIRSVRACRSGPGGQYQHGRPAVRPVGSAPVRRRDATRRASAAPPPVELPPVSRTITLAEGMTVKDLADKLDMRVKDVLKSLLDRRMMMTINSTIDIDTAREVARQFGADVQTRSFEEELIEVESEAVDAKDQVARAPGRHRHGSRRSRQDDAARLDSRRRASPSARPAASRSTSAPISCRSARRATSTSSSSTRRVTRRSR